MRLEVHLALPTEIAWGRVIHKDKTIKSIPNTNLSARGSFGLVATCTQWRPNYYLPIYAGCCWAGSQYDCEISDFRCCPSTSTHPFHDPLRLKLQGSRPWGAGHRLCTNQSRINSGMKYEVGAVFPGRRQQSSPAGSSPSRVL